MEKGLGPEYERDAFELQKEDYALRFPPQEKLGRTLFFSCEHSRLS